MSSLTVQGFKDTLQSMQATASKIIPQAGIYLGKAVAVISANPLTTVAVVAAVITVSLVVFAAYKHYQHHKQLKADNAALKNSLDSANVKVQKALETGNFAVECKNSEIEKLTNDLKQVKADLNEVKDDMAQKIQKLEEDLETEKEAAETIVAEKFARINELEKQLLSKK